MIKQLSKGKSKIYNAILKHGHCKYTLQILEHCDNSRLAVLREQYYIDLLKPEYNILKTAGSCLGHRATLETRALMSASALGRKHTAETRAKIGIAGLGRKHTAETKQKISELKKGFKHTEEARAKIIANSARAIPVAVTNLDTDVTTLYASVAAAAKAIGCRHKAVWVRVHNSDMKPYKGKFIIKCVANKSE